MAAFQTSSKWLKLALLEVHLALFLFLFPIAAVGSMDIGPASLLTVTGLLLLSSCILTYTWVFVKEIYNNRLIHVGVLISDFLVGILGISSVIVLFQRGDTTRVDNLIEAAIGTAILATVAGIFVLTEMKAFHISLPRRKQKNVKVDPTKTQDQHKDSDEKKKDVSNPPDEESAENPLKEKTVNGPFYKRSLWLKYALYLYCLSLFFNFLPTEPVMHGGTREVTTLVYFCSILAITFLFCWVFLGTLSKNRGLHVLTAATVFFTGFFSFVLMVIWLITWSMLHPFTPVLICCAGVLACMAGAATVLEIRQHKLRTQTRYLDRDCTASCFSSVIKVFGIPGVKVVVEQEKDMNGDISERYATAPPRIETTPETPVKNRSTVPMEGHKVTIMNVDHADEKPNSTEFESKGRNQTSDVDDFKDSSRKASAYTSLDPVPDGYNSPRKVPAASPFQEKNPVTIAINEVKGDGGIDGLIENDKFVSLVPAERTVSTSETYPEKQSELEPFDNKLSVQRNNEQNERNQANGKNTNARVTGLQYKDDLPPVSGMGEEHPRKPYNPFEDDD